MKFFISLITAISLSFSFSAVAKTIMLSTKGPGAGNPFWASVEAGAKDAAAELGVDLIILSPPQESDVMAQVAQIEDQIAKGVDGIAIAPTDPNAVAPILDDAMASGVPVVYIDTNGINEGVTFIGTNNINGAALAAQYICDNVPSGSDVAILQGMITQTTGQHRAEGSHKGLEACGMNIVADISPAITLAAASGLASNPTTTTSSSISAFFNAWIAPRPILSLEAKIAFRFGLPVMISSVTDIPCAVSQLAGSSATTFIPHALRPLLDPSALC
jgi:ABC-type sugar transport system substrate-binding protein